MKHICRVIKGLVVCFVLFCLGISFVSYGYQATSSDELLIQQIRAVVAKDIASDTNPRLASVEWYYAFFDTYGAAATGSKYRYISDAITPDLRSSIQQQKRMQRNSIQEKEFVALYKKQILTSDVALPTACFDNYDRIDDFAWALDIPTALLIATRKMEATCKFGPYTNGPFQIISYDYGEYEPHIWSFMFHVRDFVTFSQNKRDWYNRINDGDVADDGTAFEVALGYGDRSLTDLVRHGALYNGLSGATIVGAIEPLQQNYVYGNWASGYQDTPKDGLLVNFLKALEREHQYGLYRTSE